MSKKWWQPKNDHGNGIRGAFHAVANILTESLRIGLDKIHANPKVKGKDVAYWLSHAILLGLAVTVLYIVLAGYGASIEVVK